MSPATRGAPAANRRSPIILALETATGICSLALLRGEEPLYSLAFEPPAGHSAHLMPAVDAMVSRSGVPPSAWQAIIVSRGPGSFTGLRIGLATAKALSLGLGLPLYGVPTLPALASRLADACAEFISPLLDARKGQVFAAGYRPSRTGLREVVPPMAVEPSRLPAFIPREALFTGDGLDRYGKILEAAYGTCLQTAPPALRYPDAVAVGRLGLGKVVRLAPSELDSLVPLYVRPSDAELNYGRRRAPRTKED